MDEPGTVYYTSLSSSNFALNSAETPEQLSRLFAGMSVTTAENILAFGRGRLNVGHPQRNAVWVPNDLVAADA